MYPSIKKCIEYLYITHMLMDKNFNMVYIEATMTMVSKQDGCVGVNPEVALAAQMGNRLFRVDHVNFRLTDEVLYIMTDENVAIPEEAYLGVGTTLH